MSELAEERKRSVGHQIQTARSTRSLNSPVDVDAGGPRFADAITARIESAKRRLLEGGLLQEVEWGVVVPVVLPDLPDIRGRRSFTYSMLDVLIEQRPGLDRASSDTDRADNTVLIILDPVAITDEHLFRWGAPPHTYKVKSIDGLLQNEETGVRFASEVTVLR